MTTFVLLVLMIRCKNFVQDVMEVLLSMSKVPSNDVLERLYKLRKREFAQLKTVLEFYHMEIHQKISTPNFQRLKTMVKMSTDQKFRS